MVDSRPPLPADEHQRLARLPAHGIFDGEPAPLLDAIARQACELTDSAIGLITLLDGRWQWLRAQAGLPEVHDLPLDNPFCAHTLAGDALFEVADARLDPRFAAHPWVSGAAQVRFHAGVPLHRDSGECVGTLCVMDRRPRQLNPAQARALRGLGIIAGHAMEHGRATAPGPQPPATDPQFLRQLADSLPVRIAYLDRDRRYRFVNREMLQHFGRDGSQVIGRTRAELQPGFDDAVFRMRAQAVLAGRAQQFEFDEPVAGQLRRFENRLVPARSASGEVNGFFVTGIDITERSAAERALRELTMVFDNTTDLVVQADWRGQILYMNPSAQQAFAMRPGEAPTPHHFSALITQATLELFTQTIVPAVRGGTVWVGETRVRFADGREAPMSHMVIGHFDVQGRVERYSSVMRDISAEVLAKQEVQRQSDILRSVTEAIPATVVVVGADARYRFVNGAFERYCGLPREQILGRTAAEVLGEDEVARRRPWMKQAFAGEVVHFTLDYPAGEGSTYLALSCIPLRLESGAIDGFVGVTQDITAQKREEDRLLQLSQRDPLTGLLNRSGFERSLELLLLQQDPLGMAVLYIDLDDFKPVNDRHGHPAGDQVLEQFARRLVALVRPSDLVARVGGDEFVIALGGVREAAHAQAVADKVLAAASAPFAIGGLQLSVGACVGVAFSSAVGPAWRELLTQADMQLLAAKASGKGRQFGV